MKQATILLGSLLVTIAWHDTLAHTPFRHDSQAIFGGTSSSSTNDNSLISSTLLSGGGQSDESASSMARGGSTRTASFAADEEIDYHPRRKASGKEAELTTSSAASSRRSKEVQERDDGRGVSSKTNKGNGSSSNHNNDDKPPKKKLHLPFLKQKDDSSKRHKQIAKTLKNRNNVNVRRKVMHAAFGLTFTLLNNIVPRNRFVPGMAILSTATLVMELLRYRKGFGWMNEALHFCLGSSLRKHEMDGKFTGSFYFFTGVTLTAYCFPGTAATLGIAQLALADPSASYFGRQTRHVYWSRIENGLGGVGRNKGWLGFLGGALFCFPFNYCVLRRAAAHCTTQMIGVNAVVGVSLLLGLAGALADLAVPTPALVLPKKILGVRVPPFHVDDNMVVPIFSALACTKVFQFYGWPLDLALSKWMVL